jgi:hypothetical protein
MDDWDISKPKLQDLRLDEAPQILVQFEIL